MGRVRKDFRTKGRLIFTPAPRVLLLLLLLLLSTTLSPLSQVLLSYSAINKNFISHSFCFRRDHA